MELSLAFVKNETQVLYQNFQSDQTSRPQIFDFDDLRDKSLHGIFVPQDLLSSQEVYEKIEVESQFSPIKAIRDDQLNADKFNQLDHNEAIKLTQSTYATWTLQNNLALLENLIPTIKHLKSLWPNDRSAYFEELWQILKINLGTRNLKIAYNHLQKGQKEGEKNQLIRVVVEGNRLPIPVENKELGEALFKNYEGLFNKNFEVYSFTMSSGQLVILASINASPVIILGEVFELTKLQSSLLNALFDGLQKD